MAGSNPNENLERAIAEMRDQPIPEDAVNASARRVWQHLETAGAASKAAATAAPTPPGCAEMRAALDASRRGELSAARKLILDGHLRECASCRAYAEGVRDPAADAANWQLQPSATPLRHGAERYAWAAAAIVLIAAGVWVLRNRFFAAPAGPRATIASITGSAYLVSPTSETRLRAGEPIGQNVAIRTGANSRALVKLLDGSQVEMNERTQFSVSAAFHRISIHLDQGDIIVQSAERRAGHLYVATPNCTVTDTDTIFSVESGTKGSRVGVIEGSVSVAHGGKNSLLRAGESLATAQSVTNVPVSRQITWSSHRQRYLALLDEFSRLRKKLEQIPEPSSRYQSRILPLVPTDTALYFSLPNLGNTLVQADRIFRQELGRSPALRQWWSKIAGKGDHPSVETMIASIHSASQYLGNEVVLVASLNKQPGEAPVLLAPIIHPGLADFLRQQFGSLNSGKQTPGMLVLTERSLATASPADRGAIALVRPDFLVIGADLAAVRRMNARLNAGPSGFVETDFGKRVKQVYSQGAQIVFAANLQRILNHAPGERPSSNPKASSQQTRGSSFLRESGFGDLKYLIATRSDVSGQEENRAMLEFAGQRRGVASWLAAPSPMGSLDFVSADAGAAVSVVTRQPEQMFDDVLQLISPGNPDARQKLAETDAQLGMSLRGDLGAALGGEMTFALDGPVLPTPSWKLIVEVNSPTLLQQSIATLVNDADRDVSGSGARLFTLTEQKLNGRIFYSLRAAKAGVFSEVDYTFADGYLVAAPSRALVLAALATYANGDSLANSGSFQALLPRDDHTNFSGLLYQNLGPLLRPIASKLSSPDAAVLQRLAADAQPSAVCAYGGTDSIEVASTSSFLDLQPNAFALLKLLGIESGGTSQPLQP